MAANFARFAARRITSSTRSTPRSCAREAVRICCDQTSLVRSCRVLASVQGLQPHSSNLVQIASRKFSQYTPNTVCDVNTKVTNNSSGSSEALEESSSECEDEATNGRKRIKPHELHRDDP